MTKKLSVNLTKANHDWIALMVKKGVFQSKSHGVNFSIMTLNRIFGEKPDLLEWIYTGRET